MKCPKCGNKMDKEYSADQYLCPACRFRLGFTDALPEEDDDDFGVGLGLGISIVDGFLNSDNGATDDSFQIPDTTQEDNSLDTGGGDFGGGGGGSDF